MQLKHQESKVVVMAALLAREFICPLSYKRQRSDPLNVNTESLLYYGMFVLLRHKASQANRSNLTPSKWTNISHLQRIVNFVANN